MNVYHGFPTELGSLVSNDIFLIHGHEISRFEDDDHVCGFSILGTKITF